MKNKTTARFSPAPAALPILGLLLLAGCASSVNSYQRAQPESVANYVNDRRVVTDTTLARALRVVSIAENRVSGNLLQITATIESLKTGARSFHYKLDWIDAAGAPAGDTGWRLLSLRGRETTAVTAVATNPGIVDFRLQIVEK
ncbi:MAG: YcfL family protein [Opitutaceae bacterium]|jgi:uncharacterized protein YcfL|nr:YcfL family protein [Opitutaceae bacterium]